MTSVKKIAQIKAHGAILHQISGNRERTARAAFEMAKSEKCFYASHVFNPFFHEGTKTTVYEIFEQLGKMPDAFIIPVGNGPLLLGAYLAFQELRAWDYIEDYPKFIAVQAANCQPIATAFHADASEVSPIETQATLAEGIAIATPARGAESCDKWLCCDG